jgi:2-dehydropantoate 2-reductase
VAVAASTDVSSVRGSDIVLFCVKTLDNVMAARAMQPHLAPGATVISLQNGVDNVEQIHSATGIDAVPAVVYVACAMVAPGHVKHSGRGDLVIDDRPAIAQMFEYAGVPCRISQCIEADLWKKLIMNCAYNAMSALTRARYGRIVRASWTRDLMRQVVEEAVAVGRAAGVPLSETEMVDAAYTLGESMSGALSSTAQDISRGKPTEIDSLNGYVVRRGAELRVDTPVNQALHALVKLLEESTTATCA